MRQDLQQNQTQRLQQRLSAQQVRYVRLLEMNEEEVEAAVDRELEENPALEKKEESPTEARYYNPRPQAEPRDWSQVDADDTETLYDHLSAQIRERELPEMIRKIALYIIGNLDSNGYLQRTPAAMANDLAFGPGIDASDGQIRQALQVVQSLDPAGVGASNLREALELQLERMPQSQTRDDGLRILREGFEAFTMKHTHRLVTLLKLPQQRVDEAVALILTLNPKPGSAVGGGRGSTAAAVVPDFIVDVSPSGQISVALPSRLPQLDIEESFSEAVRRLQKKPDKESRKGNEFILSRYGDARDFIAILQQRSQTLMAVMTAIVKIQHDYFLSQDERDLRPMTLKDIAEMIGMDVSTVSRATAGKYVATPGGILPLRFFFSEGYDSGGEEGGERVSARSVQAALRALIEGEDKKHPLSDESLCRLLGEQGYTVKRRTVAKYRDNMGLPVARLRRKM